MAISREDIEIRIVEILIEHGPDGHCDGSEQLTDFVLSLVPRCDQCRFWREHGTSGSELAPAECERFTIIWGTRPAPEDALAEVGADENGDMLFFTKANFGCVQFEAKGGK